AKAEAEPVHVVIEDPTGPATSTLSYDAAAELSSLRTHAQWHDVISRAQARREHRSKLLQQAQRIDHAQHQLGALGRGDVGYQRIADKAAVVGRQSCAHHGG